MCYFGLNEDEFNTHLKAIYNPKIYHFESLKENKQDIYEKNRYKEIELANIFSK